MNEEEAERKGLSLDEKLVCCDSLFMVLSSEGLAVAVVVAAPDAVAVLKVEFSCFSFFFFFESTQKGQNHLPFGAAFNPTHTKWNHWVSHC